MNFAMVSSLGDFYKLHALSRQLFRKLPGAAVDAAVDLIMTFARNLADARPAEDLGFMISCACEARPQVAEQRLLVPLMASCAEDAASEPADGSSPCWDLLIFTSYHIRVCACVSIAMHWSVQTWGLSQRLGHSDACSVFHPW
jgi:hypothetical protein